MDIFDTLTMLGGLALFLFGMSLMGQALERRAGGKLRSLLDKMTGKPIAGFLTGLGVTAVIQSSSATTVMVVGFVNSGLMTLRQSISVIMGANVGTTVTAWLLSLAGLDGSSLFIQLLKPSSFTPVLALVGIVLIMAGKERQKDTGSILLGFAVLMYGMNAMSGAVSPLRESEAFIRLLTTFSNPLIGILVGAVFTSVLQSASAAVGILQALSMTGAVSFSAAYPIILGIAIGAAVPVLLSSLGAKVDGKRTALAYLVIEIIGVVICAAAFYGADLIVDLPVKSRIMTPVSIATVNSLFRIATTLVLLPFIGVLEQIVTGFIKESEAERNVNAEFDRLDERFLEHPALAIEQCRLTINSMARTSRDNICSAMTLLFSYDEEQAKEIERTEDLVDRYEDKLGTYLMKLTRAELNRGDSESAAKYLHTLSDFERISDHAMNVCEAAHEIHEKKIRFSPEGERELLVLSGAVNEILELSVSAFIDEDINRAYRVEPLEERIDVLCDEMKLRHVDRLQTGDCSLQTGFVFNDLLTNFERVADHCSNLAIAMIELRDDAYDTHDYVINLKEMHAHNFDELYGYYAQKYEI